MLIIFIDSLTQFYKIDLKYEILTHL